MQETFNCVHPILTGFFCGLVGAIVALAVVQLFNPNTNTDGRFVSLKKKKGE